MEIIFTASKNVNSVAIEEACAGLNLTLTMKGSLKSLPENLHWHYKMNKQPGVLEITLLINESKLIFNCKRNRSGKWVSDAVAGLKQALNLNETPPDKP